MTDNKKATKAIRDSEESLSLILDRIQNGVFIIDAETHKIVDANLIAVETLGTPKEQILGKACHEFICPAEKGNCPITDLGYTMDKSERVLIKPGSGGIPILKTVVPVILDGRKYLVESFVDLTEREKSEQQLKDIINAAPDIIHVISPDMKITTKNTASGKVFPHIKEGDHCYTALHGRDSACPHCGVTKVFKDGKKHAHESAITLPDGNKINVYSTSSPIFDENGKVVAAVEILHDITKRKKAEEKLKVFSQAVEEAADAINMMDREGKFIFVNPEFCRMHGYTPEELIGESFLITIPPEDREVAVKYFNDAVNEKIAPKAYEGKSMRKDGSTIEVHGNWSYIYKGGKINGTMAVLRDFTERKKSEQQIKDILDAAPDIIHVISPDMKITTKNTASGKAFPHIKEGDHCYEALHKRKEPCPHCEVVKVFEDGKKHAHESVITLPDGNKITVYSTSAPIFDEKGNVISAVEILRDITKRKKAQKKLKESEESFSALFNQASDCIILLDPSPKDDPVIVDANISACTMHGYTHEELIGKPISFLNDPDGAKRVSARTGQMMSGKQLTFEAVHVRKDGSTFPVEVSAQLIHIGGKPYIQAMERDITKRKKTEAVLWKYARDTEAANQLKDLFTDIMRHDLLNHLGVIRNLAEFVLEEKRFEDSEDIPMILSSTRKLEEMVNAASAYAMLESAEHIEWKEMDLNAIIKDAEESLQPYFEEKHISLEHRPRGRHAVNTISMVEEVFANLLSNAIKYSPENTSVTVDIEDSGENWRVTVKDQGTGIPDEYKEKIFNRLTRRKKEGVKGSGIGLAIVKRIADLHGGATGVLDNPEGGSVFYFEISKKEQ